MSDPLTTPTPDASPATSDARVAPSEGDPPAPAAKSSLTPNRAIGLTGPAARRWIGTTSRMLSGSRSRRRWIDSVVVGCLLTLLVIACDSAGLLWRVESLLYDVRADTFQFFLPPPTDQLLHLDIDEGAIESIAATENERFPWPRSILAELIDELALARPKVVGLDIIFPERQKPGYVPPPGATPKPVGPDRVEGEFALIDHDKLFADALTRLGCALIPVSLPFEPRAEQSDFHKALRAEVARDVTLPQAELVKRMRASGFDAPDLAEHVTREYLDAWREEISIAIAKQLRASPVSAEQLKKSLLRVDKSDIVLDKTFDELYGKALSAALIVPFGRAIPPEMPSLFSAELQHLPVPPIARAAAYSANIEYPKFRDGVVRAVPLFVRHDDRMYPQMGLAMACAQLDVDVSTLRFTADSVIVPGKEGRPDTIIPFRTYRSASLQEIPTFIDIPWWGTRKWEYMYDYPDHRAPAAHLSVVALWDMVLTRRKMATNARAADPALISLLAVFDEAAGEAYAANPPDPDDFEARRLAYETALKKIEADQTVDFIRSVPDADLDEPSRRFLAAYDLLPELMREYGVQNQRLIDGRADLRKRLEGKAIFVGWTATGVNADFVPTSIHPSCPGVVIHGAIFNAILTGELWRTFPPWVTDLVTVLLGVVMTVTAAFFPPSRAMIVAFCMTAGFVLVNGLLLFDYGNLILGAAAPLLCIVGVWQGCTLTRLIVERYQRNRIEGRFRSYVDPALVDYVVENPDQIKLEGQVREMTICFTDLGNFTPLTERLKEATVPLLNRIFGVMVPAIRKNHGYVNKFLGDGVMFFFGAPRENRCHARDAMRTVLDIQLEMRQINADLAANGLPQIQLRAGLNTGNVVVGDAGSAEASDYTVLGDDVNLASRLESANKQLGTTTLVAARTLELAGEDGLLMRPVGQICVVGRAQPVVAYEILCRQSEATDRERRLAELSGSMVDSFREARLPDCLRFAGDMDAEFGPTKLAALYRERCEFFLREPSAEDFTCTITLSSK